MADLLTGDKVASALALKQPAQMRGVPAAAIKATENCAPIQTSL